MKTFAFARQTGIKTTHTGDWYKTQARQAAVTAYNE
jgi:hypothetical protein